jgi:hypothetical protein
MALDLRPPSPGVGLCETCANVRVVETRKGSRFYLCMLSETDPRFPKYPRLPVHRCHGYQPAGDPESAVASVAEEGGG